jgi:hypothetical protein
MTVVDSAEDTPREVPWHAAGLQREDSVIPSVESTQIEPTTRPPESTASSSVHAAVPRSLSPFPAGDIPMTKTTSFIQRQQRQEDRLASANPYNWEAGTSRRDSASGLEVQPRGAHEEQPQDLQQQVQQQAQQQEGAQVLHAAMHGPSQMQKVELEVRERARRDGNAEAKRKKEEEKQQEQTTAAAAAAIAVAAAAVAGALFLEETKQVSKVK